MRTRLPVILLVVLVLLAPDGASASARLPDDADPTAPGPAPVTLVEYEAGPMLVTGDLGQPYFEELRGSVHIPDGNGPFPLVVLLHGRHGTCRYGSTEFLGAPCPDTPVTTNVRSYRGYEYLGANLASHGYVVFSINANSINTFDTTSATGASGARERAQLIARTLDLADEWNRGPGPADIGSRLVGRVDLGRIGLMGHSRGGEGVTEFIAYNRVRTDGPRYPGLRAVFALAATDFRDQRPTGVHFAALLPLCDGDVSDLQGSHAYDRSRFDDPGSAFARHHFVVQGANHNFFNTIWTNDDNGNTSGACAKSSPSRLTAADQRRVGLAIMAGFLRRYVGGETQFDGFLRGAQPPATGACPGGVAPCEALVRTSYLAPSADRMVLVEPVAGSVPTPNGALTVTSCRGAGGTPVCPTQPNRSLAQQLTLDWTGPGAIRLDLADPSDLSGFAALTLRAAHNHSSPRNAGIAKQQLDVVLVDADGRRGAVAAEDYGPALLAAPASTTRHVILNGAWLPLGDFPTVDLTRVVAVELVVGARTMNGSIQLAEVAFQR